MSAVKKKTAPQRPLSLAEVISTQTRRWKLQYLQRLEYLRRKWPEIVGPYLAEQLRPARLYKKTLRLVTADPIWLQQGVFIKEELLQKLKKMLPRPDWVEDIQVVSGAADQLPPVQPLPSRPPPLPEADAQMRRQVQQAAALIARPELSEAVARAMLSWLRLDAARASRINQKSAAAAPPDDNQKEMP